jgi:hypothetical protein
VRHAKKMRHQVTDYFKTHLGLMVAAFNTLIELSGLLPNAQGFVPLSIAEFNL